MGLLRGIGGIEGLLFHTISHTALPSPMLDLLLDRYLKEKTAMGEPSPSKNSVLKELTGSPFCASPSLTIVLPLAYLDQIRQDSYFATCVMSRPLSSFSDILIVPVSFSSDQTADFAGPRILMLKTFHADGCKIIVHVRTRSSRSSGRWLFNCNLSVD